VSESASPAGPQDEDLLEQVASMPNLASALLHVASNAGAAGVDGRTVDEVVGRSRSLLPHLRDQLRSGRYRPGDIRRVWIPKPGGGQRGLGIPNVVDRWVQQAVFQVLEPIFEPTFHDSSHGFRPNRGAHTAIAEAKKHIEAGYEIVVDLDLSDFFDRVHHQSAAGGMSRLAQRVCDGRVLKLVHRMLKAKVVMPDGRRVSAQAGSPQGGPLSPLLSNIVLDELDWALERRGLRFVRYADDVNIYVRSQRAGHRVMGSTRRLIEGRLRLKVNDAKSTVSTPDRLHFLGFRLTRQSDGSVEVGLSARTEQRIKAHIRAMTPRTWGHSLGLCTERLNRYLRGWMAYFRLCHASEERLLKACDAHIRRSANGGRAILVRQKRRSRHLYRHLRRRGVPSRAASKSAFNRRGTWYRSATPGMHRAYPNAWFATRLVSLWATWQALNPPERASGQQLMLFD